MEEKFLNLSGLTLYDRNIKEWTRNEIKQPDWEERNEESKSFVKNKPFYSEEDVIESFTKTVKPGYSVLDIGELLDGENTGLVKAQISLNISRKYDVTLDGVTYSNLSPYSVYPGFAIGIGNSAMVPFGSIPNTNTDLPFALVAIDTYWYLICETPGEHTFSISSLPETEDSPSKYAYQNSADFTMDTSSSYELFLNGQSLGTSPVMQTTVMGLTVNILGDPSLFTDFLTMQGVTATPIENTSGIEGFTVAVIVEQESMMVLFSETSDEDNLSFTFSIDGLTEEINTSGSKYYDGSASDVTETDSGTEVLSANAPWFYIANFESPFTPTFPSLGLYENKKVVLSLGNYSVEGNVENILEDTNYSAILYGINIDQSELRSLGADNVTLKQGYMGIADATFMASSEEIPFIPRLSYVVITPDIFSSSLQTLSIDVYDVVVHTLDKKYVDISWDDVKEKPRITDEELDGVFDNYYGVFDITENGILSVKDKSKLPVNLIIPETFNGVKVKSLINGFALDSGIETLVINAPLKKIIEDTGYGPFQDCYCLRSVALPSSLEDLSTSAFYGCSSLTEISLPSALKELDGYCLRGTSIKEVVIPSTVTHFGSSAFEDCSDLESVEIQTPSALRYINEEVFENCTSLTSITLSCPSLESIGNYTFRGCTSLRTAIIESPNKSVSFGSDIFRDCSSLEEVSILTGSTYLNRLFYGNNSLKKLTLPSTLTNISYQALWYCHELRDIYYDGTTEQWNSISKGSNWKTTTVTVHCSDGNIEV